MLSCIVCNMEKKVTYVKDAHLHIRVDSDDLMKWKTLARIMRVDLTTYVINTLNSQLKGTPLPKSAK